MVQKTEWQKGKVDRLAVPLPVDTGLCFWSRRDHSLCDIENLDRTLNKTMGI